MVWQMTGTIVHKVNQKENVFLRCLFIVLLYKVLPLIFDFATILKLNLSVVFASFARLIPVFVVPSSVVIYDAVIPLQIHIFLQARLLHHNRRCR